jgi:hypothetical protein
MLSPCGAMRRSLGLTLAGLLRLGWRGSVAEVVS